MKKITIFLMCLLLCGCSPKTDAMDIGLKLRSDLLSSSECVFDASITADYGNKIYTFAMGCEFDAHGNMSFTVTEPETIENITGQIHEEGGVLTFDETALFFPLLTDNQISPISAPWIFIKTVRSGFITSAGYADEKIRLIIDDSYADKAMTVHVWINSEYIPVLAEIYWNNRRILTVEVNNFVIM